MSGNRVIAFSLILGVGLFGCTRVNNTTSSASADASSLPPLAVTADELTTEFMDMGALHGEARKAKREKYKGRSIEVSGEVLDTSFGSDGTKKTMSVMLKGRDNPEEKPVFGSKYLVVFCEFDSSSPLYQCPETLKEHMRVKVRGRFVSALDFGVSLGHCELVEPKE
jgi:hypothetical protein